MNEMFEQFERRIRQIRPRHAAGDIGIDRSGRNASRFNGQPLPRPFIMSFDRRLVFGHRFAARIGGRAGVLAREAEGAERTHFFRAGAVVLNVQN